MSDATTLSRRQRLRRLARWRRAAAPWLLAATTLVAVAWDLSRRGVRPLEPGWYYRGTYAASVLESLVLWSLLLCAAARRRSRVAPVMAGLFVVGLTFTLGGQRYFHDQYNAYLNVDVSVFASNFMDSVANQLFADFGTYLWAKLPFLLFALALVSSFFIPTQHRHVQASTPDVLYLHAVGGLVRTQLGMTDQSHQLRPRARESLPVRIEHPPGDAARNVLYVILESVRADAVCTAPEPGCELTPYTDRLTPRRFPLLQMRSLASCTAISLAVLWSGVGPTESRETLHTWPLIFDYAREAGYHTAFWTSQNMIFGNARLWVKNLGVEHFVSATDLDPMADLDMGAPEHLLAAHIGEHIDALEEPFLAVVQLSNGHFPYYVDPDGPQPFQPATVSKAPEENQHFFNYYRNAIHQQDAHVAAIIEHLERRGVRDRTAIVYTSDHGEAFREHNQMGHTFSVLDEEIHVPAWIDVPAGMIDQEQERQLAARRDAFTFHPDLTATVLDLLGLLDDPGLDPYRSKLQGSSLLRSAEPPRAVALTNCAGVWSCAFENWGYMRGKMKLEARAWDPEWHCYDLESDPYEAHNLGAEACGDLRDRALETFERLPGRRE